MDLEQIKPSGFRNQSIPSSIVITSQQEPFWWTVLSLWYKKFKKMVHRNSTQRTNVFKINV